MQILEQLAPLQLAKEHLPSDIIDILERLGKVDNIPFNQLYYIAENCVDRYYSKVIQAFISIIKRQFADRQTLLVNTAHSLKFLEDYANRQAQICKILCKYHNLPDEVADLHLHFDSFNSFRILDTFDISLKCKYYAKMNASSWRKAADLTAQETQATQQIQAAATADSSQLESLLLSSLAANDSGLPQVNYGTEQPPQQVHQGQLEPLQERYSPQTHTDRLFQV